MSAVFPTRRCPTPSARLQTPRSTTRCALASTDPATGAIVLIMQRLHELDPTGHLLEQEPGVWTHLSILLEAEKDELWTFRSRERRSSASPVAC